MTIDERMERLERLSLACWDGYLETTAVNQLILRFLAALLNGQQWAVGMNNAELEAWLERHVAESENEVLIDVEKVDAQLAALLSQRAGLRRQQEKNSGTSER